MNDTSLVSCSQLGVLRTRISRLNQSPIHPRFSTRLFWYATELAAQRNSQTGECCVVNIPYMMIKEKPLLAVIIIRVRESGPGDDRRTIISTRERVPPPTPLEPNPSLSHGFRGLKYDYRGKIMPHTRRQPRQR